MESSKMIEYSEPRKNDLLETIVRHVTILCFRTNKSH